MDILNMVVQPTWREFLVELISTHQMDPWDIDVTALADVYLAKVRELQALDLRMPANVILASALLLHFKAESLKLDQGFSDEQATVEEETRTYIDEEVPDLVFRPNIPKSRRVTLDELMNAVEQVMGAGRIRPRSHAAPVELTVELPKEDMHEIIARFYLKACSLKDSEGVLTYSSMLSKKHADEISKNMLPLLHLVQEGRLLMWQDELFGEIFIKYVEEEAWKAAQAFISPKEAEAVEATADAKEGEKAEAATLVEID
ncbi:MAG: segregation/condensation protein A [Candidatus Micrarchaeia archaeon]